MSRIGTTRVPPDGPRNARIMVVGEAPGGDEEALGKPFVGFSGDLMNRYFEFFGFRRSEMFVTNLSQYRPDYNKFDYLVGSEQLDEGLRMLAADIREVNPHVIVAMGAWPMYHLTGQMGKKNNKPTPGTGILPRRGSVYPNTLVPDGPKVLCSSHPAWYLRQWGMTPILRHDIGRAVDEAMSRDLFDQPFKYTVDPDEETMRWWLAEPWLAFDIETDRKHKMTCIGFARSPGEAIIITPNRFDDAMRLLESPANKIGQNATGFDLPWLQYHGYTVKNFRWDTYVAARHLDPEFPQSLAFLTSIYTRRPYHKDQASTDLFRYCALDNVCTFEIAMKQRDEIKELY